MAQTKTIAERLERPQQLNSTVRSYSYGEYAEKRANYVGFDKYGAGADWGNLAKALDGFYGEFRHYANDVYLPQWKERGIAEGQEKFNAHSETEGYTKNRLAFKEFVEQHPEMASNNPWVKVGYEQARLNTLSMEMENGLQQAMVENGMMNEEDETKVQQFARNYMKFFKDQAGLSGYEDSVLLAKNFGSKEAQIFDGAMDRYLHVKNQQMQEKLADATIKEGVSVITNMLNGKSSQGLDPDLPENIDSKNILAVLSGIAERQAENGLLDSKGKDVVWGMIRSAYAQTNNRNVLKLCENAMFKGMKIIDDPQIAEWYNRTWEHLRNEDARKAREARADRERAMAYQTEMTSWKYATMCYDSGKPFAQVAEEEGLLEKMGEKAFRKLSKSVAADISLYHRSKTDVYNNPQLRIENERRLDNALEEGKDGIQFCLEQARGTGNKWWIDKATQLEKEQNSEAKALSKAEAKAKTQSVSALKGTVKKTLEDTASKIKGNEGIGWMINRGAISSVNRNIGHQVEKDFYTIYDLEMDSLTDGGQKPQTEAMQDRARIKAEEAVEAKIPQYMSSVPTNLLVSDIYSEEEIVNVSTDTRLLTEEEVSKAFPILNEAFGIPRSLLKQSSRASIMTFLKDKKIHPNEITGLMRNAGL